MVAGSNPARGVPIHKRYRVIRPHKGLFYWHKVQNCKRCGAKKTVKKCLWGHPTQEAFESGEWAIMGCCMERVRSRWACTKCEWKYYHPQDLPEYIFIGAEHI